MLFSKIASRKKTMILAIASGVMCAVCLGLYMTSIENEAQAAQAEILSKYGGDQVEVCVAKRNINAGEIIADSDIETRTWVASLLPKDAITVRGDAIGKQVGSTILSGDVISAARFDSAGSDIEVPEGYTAISVPAKQIQAVGGALKAGMRTDVYSVGANSTDMLASSVLVLATSQAEDSASSNNAWVTLAVLPSRVEEIVSAAQNLDLYFVLPSEDSNETLEDNSGNAKSDSLQTNRKISDQNPNNLLSLESRSRTLPSRTKIGSAPHLSKSVSSFIPSGSSSQYGFLDCCNKQAFECKRLDEVAA